MDNIDTIDLSQAIHSDPISAKCIVCGNEIPFVSGYADFICNDCKEGIIYAKELASTGIGPTEIADAIHKIKEQNNA